MFLNDLTDFSNYKLSLFSAQTDADKPRKNNWGRNGAIIGALSTLPNLPGVLKMPASPASKAIGIGLGAAINTGIGYGIGKGLQKLAGKSNPKDPNKKPKNWRRTLAKVATAGALGAGAIGLTSGAMSYKRANSIRKNALSQMGVSNGASKDEIKRQYRKLARNYHPDLHAGNEDMMRNLNNANEILSKKGGEYEKLQKLRKGGNLKLISGSGLLGAGGLGVYSLNRTKNKQP